MNQRIQELAFKAANGMLSFDEHGFRLSETEAMRFAQLIVQECLLSLEPDLYSKEIDYEFEQRFYKRCRDKIIKHFGVEQ